MAIRPNLFKEFSMTAKPKKALYPYTISPIALNMNESEFKSAQLALFERGSQAFGLKSVRKKEWIVLGVLIAVSVAGIAMVRGYSTILFWLLIGLCIGYLIARTKGMAWYARREFDKQIASVKIPPELSELKLGVQPTGLVMSMPMPSDKLDEFKATQKKRGHTQQNFAVKGVPSQQAVIPWDKVTSWDETDDFIFIMFEVNEQKGSQIIPKRLKNSHFPIDTILKHLSEVKAKGLDLPTALPN